MVDTIQHVAPNTTVSTQGQTQEFKWLSDLFKDRMKT